MMKVVSLKRLGDSEQRLIDAFPDIDFSFKKGLFQVR